MTKRYLDPSQAIVDVDVTGLTFYSLVPQAPDAKDVPPGSWTMSITLAGGIGRVPGPGGTPVITDKVNHMQISGVYLTLEPEHVGQMTGLLERWMQSNMPLRFLDFGEEALLMEDGQNYITLPPGSRNVNANVNSAWLDLSDLLKRLDENDSDEDIQ